MPTYEDLFEEEERELSPFGTAPEPFNPVFSQPVPSSPFKPSATSGSDLLYRGDPKGNYTPPPGFSESFNVPINRGLERVGPAPQTQKSVAERTLAEMGMVGREGQQPRPQLPVEDYASPAGVGELLPVGDKQAAQRTLNEMGQEGVPQKFEIPGGGSVTTTPELFEDFMDARGRRDADRTGLAPQAPAAPFGAPQATAPLRKSMPTLTNGLSDADRKTIAAMGGGPEAEKMVRQARQEFHIKTAATVNNNKRVAKSLQDQGFSREQIMAEIGTPQNASEKASVQRAKDAGRTDAEIADKLASKRSADDVSSILSRKQRKIDADKEAGGRISRREGRLEKLATTRAPIARVLDLKNEFETQSEDPDGGDIQSNLSKSDRARYEKFLDAASNGRVTKGDMQNAERMLKKAQAADKTKIAQKEFKRVEDLHGEKVAEIKQRIKSSEDRVSISKNNAQLKQNAAEKKKVDQVYTDLWADLYDEKVPDKEKPTLEEVNAAREASENFDLMKGITVGSGEAPTVTTKAQFDALASGEQYMEDDGKVYVKP